jgi:hypothetical protein
MIFDLFAKDLTPFRLSKNNRKATKRSYSWSSSHHHTVCGFLASLIFLAMIGWFITVKV